MSGASSSSSSSTTSTTQPRQMRVYNRRPRMTSAQARDCAGSRQSLLEKVFRSLEVSDLQSARETCRKWKAQVNNQGAVSRGGGADPAPAAVADHAESWMDTIESILEHLQELHQLHDVEVDVMVHFLVQEGIIKAP